MNFTELLDLSMECSENAKNLSDEKLKELKDTCDSIFTDSNYFFIKDELKLKLEQDSEALIFFSSIIKQEIRRREIVVSLNKSVVETKRIIQEFRKEMKIKKNQEKSKL
jgi:hypothetical protein